MGLVFNNLLVFLDARRRGASFARTLTMGRQQMTVSAGGVRRLAEVELFRTQQSDYTLSNCRASEPWTSLLRAENAIEHNA